MNAIFEAIRSIGARSTVLIGQREFLGRIQDSTVGFRIRGFRKVLFRKLVVHKVVYAQGICGSPSYLFLATLFYLPTTIVDQRIRLLDQFPTWRSALSQRMLHIWTRLETPVYRSAIGRCLHDLVGSYVWTEECPVILEVLL
ncbi:hypothetical protein M501DRAFT_681068 [Patellaria atrata CBS 101060]|uniref:Uncharacterized protein n=1 Tax=Patellaria atrata CBS 101060 TaxID=1346257 RepID=A0A9P4VQT1_9PEZI|nr:hypothetical protein M501DRAFT_681068 [Patellaria atrata CBS 101060]